MQGCICFSWIPKRYVICFLCFLGMMLTYILRFCLSIAITEMIKEQPRNITAALDRLECPYDPEDDFSLSRPIHGDKGEFSWDERTQGLVLSSFFWGYVLTHVPGGLLAQRWGGKKTLGGALLVSAICSVLTPFAARRGPWGLVVLRIIMGLGQGFVYPSLGAIVARWAPAEERGRLGTLVFTGAMFGNMVSMILSGLVLKWTGGAWSSLFYLYGGIALVWLILWVFMGYSKPEDHPGLTEAEKTYLEQYSVSVSMKQKLPPTPWGKILTSKPLWGLVIAQIGHDWGLFTIINDLPKYMKNVMHFSVAQTGLRTALPYMAMLIVALLSSGLLDFLLVKKVTSITALRKIFATVSYAGPALGIVGASYAGCDREMASLFFILGMGLMGFFYPSIKVNAIDLSPNYAGTIMALVGGIGATSGIITPYLVGLMVPENTMMQWRQVFLVAAAALIVTNIIFVIMGSGEVQPWNDMPTIPKPPGHAKGRLKYSTWRKPWNPKQSWYCEPAPIRSATLVIR